MALLRMAIMAAIVAIAATPATAADGSDDDGNRITGSAMIGRIGQHPNRVMVDQRTMAEATSPAGPADLAGVWVSDIWQPVDEGVIYPVVDLATIDGARVWQGILRWWIDEETGGAGGPGHVVPLATVTLALGDATESVSDFAVPGPQLSANGNGRRQSRPHLLPRFQPFGRARLAVHDGGAARRRRR